MDAYEKIEEMVAKKYGSSTTSRKNIGDFMLSSEEAVDVKSNNIHKNNFSPNMVSAKKAYDYLMEGNLLYFVFVDYELQGSHINILEESDLIPINYIDWSCLSIQCQGNGVIQKSKPLKIVQQSVDSWIKELKDAYSVYIEKERTKLLNLERHLELLKNSS